MDDWHPIDTAPQDGTIISLRNADPRYLQYEDRLGCFATLHADAPSRKSLGPDPLGRMKPTDYQREAAAREAFASTARWLTADRMYALPPPSHWRPRP